ncbi:hypothetical protein AAC387_Pa02g1663 [Persea americana]
MPPHLRDETTQGTSYSCNSVVGFSMNGYESSDTASDTDEWEESLEAGEYLSDEEWIPESQLMPVEPQRADEEEDLAPMPDLEEYARILQRLAIKQEQDHINQLHQNPEPEVLENLQISPPDDSASEASSAEATDSQNAFGSISSEATYSRVTSTEIAPSQPSSPETVTSEFKPLPTDHHEEALANEDLFPKIAPCNAITEDDNAAAEAFSANGEDRPLEPEGGLPKEEPPLEAFEVGKGTYSGRDYHKSYNQPSSSSYLNPSGKQAINAPSDDHNENGSPKEALKLQIGDLISEVTVYVIKTPSCYNILLGRPWIHENGVVPSTLHQCIKFIGDDGLIHRVFADKKPFKEKEVHFADSQMYEDEKEEKEEKIASFAGNLQKDKGKAPQQSSEENKPSDKPGESNPSPFFVSFKSSKPLVITTKVNKRKQKTRGKFAVSFVSIIQDTDSDSETEDNTSPS